MIRQHSKAEQNDCKKRRYEQHSTESKRVFMVKPIQQFSKPSPSFRQPVEYGNFSLDGERKFHHDNRQLRYYLPPTSSKIHFDLSKGYDTCVEKDDDIKERLTHLLTWISKNKQKFQLNDQGKSADEEKLSESSKTKLNTDFVSWRGHFTKFLCTPYENRDPWQMAVTLCNGTIYISEVETEKGKNDRLNRPPRQREMCYWGYKFEDYVTKHVQDNDSDIDKDVNTNEAYCSVVRTRLKNHSILIGAEVDCCQKTSGKKPPENYIELKTTRLMDNYRQEMNFSRFKLKKFWGQSFLAGVPEIIVGLRDDNGVVKDLKTYNTLDIPNICKEYSNSWDASVCINFLDSLLSWLKELVVVDDVNTVYMLTFDQPFERILVNRTNDGSERFLPQWYTNQM